MRTFNIFSRLTHKYRDDYRHLDKEVFVAKVKATPAKFVELADSFDQGGKTVQTVTVPSGMKDSKLIIKALEDTLSYHGCSCEHDCCGCQIVFSSAKRVSRNRYSVHSRISYNY